MKSMFPVVLAALLPTLAGCGSVAPPAEQFYRLEWPRPAGGELPRLGALRVLDLQAASHLQGDGLVLAHGPVQLQRSDVHRWLVPVDRLVTEALVQGLGRTRMFTVVKDAGDAGGEDLTLDGRVLAFEQVAAAGGLRARVVLELWIEQAGRPRLRTELQAEVPCPAATAEGAVQALSQGLAEVLDQLVAELRPLAPGTMIDAAPGR